MAGRLNTFEMEINMNEIGSGILVYFENRKNFKNVVFLPHGKRACYQSGGMLFELIKDDAFFMVTTKVVNMIKAFPGYYAEASIENVTEGFKWLYGTIEDEDFPVATELFRSCFNEVIHDVAGKSESYDCVGNFFSKCYEEYVSHIEVFSMYVDAIAAYNSGMADEFQADIANNFISSAQELSDLYMRKCSVRHKNGNIVVDTVQIKSFLQLLTFEYCRMKKENKLLKICKNCGRYFIPPKRSDSIYCPAPSPQNPEKACSEIGANFRQTVKRRNDPIEREFHTNSCRIQNIVRRLIETGAREDHIEKFKVELQKEKKKYQDKKKIE